MTRVKPTPCVVVSASTCVEHCAAYDDNGYGQNVPPSVYVYCAEKMSTWVEWDPSPTVTLCSETQEIEEGPA